MKWPQTFKRSERLKSRTLIRALFSKGSSIAAYPIRMVWLDTSLPHPDVRAQAAFTVPKRHFPRAVHRNRIKRQIREAYRLQKSHFYQILEEEDQQLAIMFIFMGKEPVAYELIERSMRQLIKRWRKKRSKRSRPDSSGNSVSPTDH